MKPQTILYFDGVCGLCNRYVDFVLKRDHKRKFLFSPLQSEYAKTHLPNALTEDLGTLVLCLNHHLYTKSDAVIETCKTLGGFWGAARAAYVLPRRFRDRIYDIVASHRYKWLGVRHNCRIPTPAERERFLL